MLKHWPPLNALRGFEAAARLGSFHKAAEELHLTQSAISQQIRSLESYLEQPLFFRQGRSVALTDAGFDLLSTTQALLQQLAVGIRRLEQYRKPNQLVVNTTPAFARHWLLPHLAEFHRLHPQIDLWLFTSDEVPDMATQTIDVAVRDDLTAQAECSYRVLLEDRLLPVAHPTLRDEPARRATHHPAWRARNGLEPLAGTGRRERGPTQPGTEFFRPRPAAGCRQPGPRHCPDQRAAVERGARTRHVAATGRTARSRPALELAGASRQRSRPADRQLLSVAG